jgi:hypothetical protein
MEFFAQFLDYINLFTSADLQNRACLDVAVTIGLMQHSLLQLGFGMQSDICVGSQLLIVHIQFKVSDNAINSL